MRQRVFLIVKDEASRQFMIEGPLDDVTLWQTAVVRACNSGRKIVLERWAAGTAERVIADCLMMIPDYSLAPSGSLVHPTDNWAKHFRHKCCNVQ